MRVAAEPSIVLDRMHVIFLCLESVTPLIELSLLLPEPPDKELQRIELYRPCDRTIADEEMIMVRGHVWRISDASCCPCCRCGPLFLTVDSTICRFCNSRYKCNSFVPSLDFALFWLCKSKRGHRQVCLTEEKELMTTPSGKELTFRTLSLLSKSQKMRWEESR